MNNDAFRSVAVIGLGYVGLPTATLFALNGLRVFGVDIQKETVETINRGGLHFVENELGAAVEAVVAAGRLSASTEVREADAFVVAVPTPFAKQTGAQHPLPDLSYVKAAVLSIAPVLRKGNLVVLESTCPVGTTDQLVDWLSTARPDLLFPTRVGGPSDVFVAYCPERVLPGKVMIELVSNDRIIGGMTPACGAKAAELFRVFLKGQCLLTDSRTAEMCKLAENTFRDINIAYANELSMLCESLGIDVYNLIALANRHPRVNILQPGAGVGGHCIAVDPWFLVAADPEKAKLTATARLTNDAKAIWVFERVLEQVKVRGPDASVACYGLSFKPNIDDFRESPALHIAEMLAAAVPNRILIAEPYASKLPRSLDKCERVNPGLPAEADIHVFLVAHDQFKAMPRPEGDILDYCGIRKSSGWA